MVHVVSMLEVPILLGSTSFQSKEVKGAQYSLVLLLSRFDGRFSNFPETKVVAGGSEEIGGFTIGLEHELCGWVRVVEGKGRLGSEGKPVWIEGDYVHPVTVVLEETAESDALVVDIHGG
ncbi:hypothetical protein V6N11_058983 [Hibiscus sabdariffa]|uniref:Uncharacterized protein n=1 Tax=Hibiscus sabdariffa TaxID=183260 RepID=A0ABR2U6J8_9ROSI